MLHVFLKNGLVMLVAGGEGSYFVIIPTWIYIYSRNPLNPYLSGRDPSHGLRGFMGYESLSIISTHEGMEPWIISAHIRGRI